MLGVVLVLIDLMFVRMHGAAAQETAAQDTAAKADIEAGRFIAQALCTECHSVERETAGTGTFAPDFTVIASRRSSRWLHAFLLRPHVRMPEFEFKREHRDNLVAYIASLKPSKPAMRQ
jgi:mono/diheme cytochrome c family protein